MDEPEQIIRLLQSYPEFRVIYEDAYRLCLNIEKVMEMFSEELLEFDRNTVDYMIDEMQNTIDVQKEQLETQKEQLEAQEMQLEMQKEQLKVQDAQLETQKEQIEYMSREMEKGILIIQNLQAEIVELKKMSEKDII